MMKKTVTFAADRTLWTSPPADVERLLKKSCFLHSRSIEVMVKTNRICDRLQVLCAYTARWHKYSELLTEWEARPALRLSRADVSYLTD
jgi:hypothetical protein